ncbi:MAG: D-alanine--D-alanine ligase [Spirochaetes bacterium]|nr:D-alanine--D-alanine ligase [Spirochaetota bacterium]
MQLSFDKNKVLAYFKNIRIGVLCGGLSDEREVSLRSGTNVYNALKEFPLDVSLIDVQKDIASVLMEKKIGYVYNTLHGTYGEDGVMQGILEMLGVGYTGENVLVSSLCMNKTKAKEVWAYYGLSTPQFALLERLKRVEGERLVFDRVTLTLPVVIKPRENGSSVNVFIVKTAAEFASVTAKLAARDFFVEEFIKGKEVTVGVLRVDGRPFTLPILGINPKNEFYDYEAKYTHGRTEFEMPAKLDVRTEGAVCALVKNAYDALDCEGVCRIDVIIDGNGNPHLIENNTQPGMTDTSDLPQMAKQAGIAFDDFVLYILGYKVVR